MFCQEEYVDSVQKHNIHGTYLLSTDRHTCDAIHDAIIASEASLLLQPVLLELGGFRLNFIIKEANELRLGVWRGISNIVKTKNSEKLRYGERGGVKVGIEIFPQPYDLCSSQ